MRNLFLLSVLLGSLGSFGYLAGASGAQAQEKREPQDRDVNFDIGGPDMDLEVQRREVEAAGAAAGVVGTVVLLIELAIAVLVIVAMWKIFAKAGKPGWAAIIPIYNLIVILEICGRPIWWILLLLIPCVNIIVSLIVLIDLAKSFGKGELFGVGLWLLGFVFFPVLGFGEAQYRGPAAAQ